MREERRLGAGELASMEYFLDKFLGRCTNTAQHEELAGAAGAAFTGLKSRCGVAWDVEQAPVTVPYASSRGRGPAVVAEAFYAGREHPLPPTAAPRPGTEAADVDSAGGPISDCAAREDSQSPPASARSEAESGVSDMSLEEKAKEKSRLQRLLKDFAKESVAGIPVLLVTPDAGRKSPYFFQMDRKLTVFSIRPGDGTTAESGSTCAQDFFVKDVTAIYKGPEVSAKAPYLGNSANACVGLNTNRDCTFFFHFDDNYERDRFYTCLQILRMSVDIKGLA